MSDSPIRFEEVSRRFDRQIVLNRLDFSVEPGQVYALLGRNGAGKTTALRILLGFLEPHAGRTLVFGRDSRELRPEDRGRVGFVGEGQKLPFNMSARSIFDFEKATRPNFDLVEAQAMLGRCGIPEKKRIYFLSRGQRAQVALIVAIASRPDLLILDDPAMGLDPLKRREVLDAMIDFLAERGGSVLFSSHILGDVERMADRVGILDQGSLIVDATMEDLKSRVRRRRIRCDGKLPDDVRIMKANLIRDGLDLIIRDEDEALVHSLRVAGDLSDPEAITLEDLFIALMGGGGSLQAIQAEEVQA